MTYKKPITEIIQFDTQDIITTSGENRNNPNNDDKWGNGWGDKNHKHNGPKGKKEK